MLITDLKKIKFSNARMPYFFYSHHYLKHKSCLVLTFEDMGVGSIFSAVASLLAFAVAMIQGNGLIIFFRYNSS